MVAVADGMGSSGAVGDAEGAVEGGVGWHVGAEEWLRPGWELSLAAHWSILSIASLDFCSNILMMAPVVWSSCQSAS